LVSEREPETLHLEFRMLGMTGLDDRNARKNFAKALSESDNAHGHGEDIHTPG
jgi:hypothetical protein